MGWRDLLQQGELPLVSPWVGGRVLQSGPRTWTIDGSLPAEYGWFTFAVTGRHAHVAQPASPDPTCFRTKHTGYLAGDRLVPDDVRFDVDPARWARTWPPVYLLEPLDRFTRVVVGQTFEDGPLIYDHQAFPLGPEDDVRHAYEDEVPSASVTRLKDVTPALYAAFAMADFQRKDAERRRQQLRIQAAERAAQEAAALQRQHALAKLGDGAGRREMAKIDFAEAARAALALSGATYLDHRPVRNEYIVRFRFLARRFECICDDALRIISSGICLTDHVTGEKGDTYLTLESLPGTIAQADREGKLVVFRHV